MILILTDSHCVYSSINDQIQFAEEEMGVEITSVLHLGDLGIFKPELDRFFTRDKNRFRRPLQFIEGNHEDFDILPWMENRYKDQMTHLKRGTVHQINGYRVLAIGGANYMDAMATRMAAIITDADIDRCLSIPPDTIDIIVSHDCPVGIGVPNTTGLEYYGDTGFKRSDELNRHFKPKLWIFGHHHKWFQYNDGVTAYYGLPASWRGFGLLDNDFRFTLVEHTLPLPNEESWFDRMLKKLGLIRPNLSHE